MRLTLKLATLALLSRPLPAATDPTVVAAQSILARRCLQCHGAARMSSLDLRDRASALRGGTRGASLIPNRPAESLLLTVLSGAGDLKMPPGPDPLPPAEIELLRQWIAAGAQWPDSPVEPSAQPGWWSFRKLVRPAIPQGAAHSHVIDAFIENSLAQKNLKPAPLADRRTLIRRLYLDLVGLPPPPDKVEAFAADPSPEAWPRLVDQLLASPQYGERWARHWLDVVRYADSGGYETDIYYKNAWRYRDYVIKSLNDDKPYDRFVQEQIAGDEMWPGNLDLHGTYEIPKQSLAAVEAQTATGLYALGPEVHESNMDSKKLQYEKLTDWVDTTGAAFLGLTVGCARCHDHKFDPIAQRDYYRLAAIFAYSTEAEIPLVHRMSIRDHGQHYPRVVAVTEARTAYRLYEEQVRKRIAESRKALNRTGGFQLEKEATPEESAELKRLLAEIGKAVLAVPDRDAQRNVWDGLMDIPTATVLTHRDPRLVPETFIYARGELSGQRDKVAAGLPAFLGGRDIVAEDCSGRCTPLARKQLALWLTAPDHPLTARVMVNRLWQGHFGQGIVATPNDFGRQGQPPVFPELLDWLAAEFVAQGWSLKAMHRLILTSDAYQRASSYANPENTRIDPANRYLWRANRRRLEGEALWDQMHAVAGSLNLTAGGKPTAPPLATDEVGGLASTWQWPVNADPAEHNRRGVYLLVRRNFPYPMFEAFDAPVNAVSCPQRDVSSVAPQALWFLNNQVAYQQAGLFAARLGKEAGDKPEAWVDLAWRLAFGRPPSTRESAEAVGLIGKLSLEKFCLSIFNLNEFSFVD